MLPGQAILPHRWAGFSSQPTPISKGIKTLRDIANTAYSFFLTLQAKAVTCILSLCEKTDYPRVLFLISSLLFAKSSPFSGKSRLVFPRSSHASFFSLPICRTRWGTSPLYRTVFNRRCRPFSPLTTTYRRECLTFLA